MGANDRLGDVRRLHHDYSARFGIKLLRVLMNQDDSGYGNIAVSPARLQAVMVLLANWASPTICKEILERVGDGGLTLEEANVLSSKKLIEVTLHDRYKDETGDNVPVIEQQTILWVKRELEVQEEALARVADDFALVLRPVDFGSTGLKDLMDKTVREATHGLIKRLDLLLSSELLAVITDVLYFKAAWVNVFEVYDTRKQLFHGTKGKVSVPMMHRTGYMDYAETSVCQMVCLPYICHSNECVGFSMHVYLPKPHHSVTEVLDMLEGHALHLDTDYWEVELSLPRFSVEANVDMYRLLEAMGLACVFKSTDLIPDCIKGLQVGQLVQQTKVVVDEQGTEAAAVTFVAMVGCCPPVEKPKLVVMKVDRPFLFEIVEERTNTILFAGIIYNSIESI